MDAIRGVLLDLSGVLYQGNEPIPQARQALAFLQHQQIPFLALTNSCQKTPQQILKHLQSLGLALPKERLMTALDSAHDYCLQQQLQPFVVGHPQIMEQFADLVAHTQPAVLVADPGAQLDYNALNEAFRLLQQGVPFLAIADNRYYQTEQGIMLDMGAWVAGLAYASDRLPTLLGKPAEPFFNQACQRLGVAPQHCVMIGDDVVSDVNGAIAAGLQAALVETGKYQAADQQKKHPQAYQFTDVLQALTELFK